MELLFVIVPVFIIVVFVIIFVQMGKQAAEWMDNNSKPIETVSARVVAKRSDTGGSVSSRQGGMVSTTYYATFEFDSGDRREFCVNGPDYGLLAEGDQGVLTHQGTRFHRFERRKVV